MIAPRLLPLALLVASGANAQMVGRDVPAPRAIQLQGLAVARGGASFAPVAWRETPAVMMGSADRYVPVARAPRMSACRAAALVGMMRDDAGRDSGFTDETDAYFEDDDFGGFDDGFGR